MKKKNIAVIAGGYSGEYVISIDSAKTICKNLDKNRYNVFLILIIKEKWVYLDDDQNEHPVDKDDFSITLKNKKIQFDCALITIHGSPGEDGKLQGYFEMLDIPYTTAGLLASALTFNKYFCKLLMKQWGVKTARSVKFHVSEKPDVSLILSSVNLPAFVKPNKGGSSLGTTLVNDRGNLMKAVGDAFNHDDEVFIEEYVDGTELTCGAFLQKEKIKALPVTEIISKTKAQFFDFEAKYTKGAADEITPARISKELTVRIQDLTAHLYNKLELKGIARFDYISKEQEIFFLEVNITPGMAATSIVPQQAETVGITITELFTMVIEEALHNTGY